MADPIAPVPADEIHPLADPTICADCRKDNGDRDFSASYGRFLCPDCRSHQKRIHFPSWARVACAGCIILGGWGFFRSIRISRGIRAYYHGMNAFRMGDCSEAAAQLRLARTFMPGEETFEDLEAFYQAHACLDEENPEEAARWFQISLNLDPNSKETAYMLLVARRRAAFKARKYDEYFRNSESLLELEGRTAQALLGMAPAWACRFALTGKEEYRQQALACLEEARTAGGADSDDWIIEGWVNHIIENRTIMSLLDFRYFIGRGGGEDKDFG